MRKGPITYMQTTQAQISFICWAYWEKGPYAISETAKFQMRLHICAVSSGHSLFVDIYYYNTTPLILLVNNEGPDQPAQMLYQGLRCPQLHKGPIHVSHRTQSMLKIKLTDDEMIIFSFFYLFIFRLFSFPRN